MVNKLTISEHNKVVDGPRREEVKKKGSVGYMKKSFLGWDIEGFREQ